MRIYKGTGASGGVAAAPITVVEVEAIAVPDVEDPKAALATAVEAVVAHLGMLTGEAAERGRDDAAEILKAQSMMAEDPALVDGVTSRLDSGARFDEAILAASSELQEMLAALPDPYLAARAADVGEVTTRIRRHLAGLPLDTSLDVTEPTILIAHELTAAETATLDPELVVGFATEVGGPTSHVAIIARALGVPAVVGIAEITSGLRSGGLGLIDGTTGEIVIEPDAATRNEFESRVAKQEEVRRIAERFRGAVVTYGGSAVDVAANVASPDDTERAVAELADGVGLMRTEFLVLDRPNQPTEDEQYEAYSAVLSAFDKQVVIRTFDIGGDKPAQFLDLPIEENPFLGVRGVRLYRRVPELFRSQLRALLRAAVHGNLGIMIPMVATASEIVEVKAELQQAKAELEDANVAVGEPELGIMVEVPSVALVADVLAPMVDFFSIGTNDLTQYALAADRVNGELEALQDPLHPAVHELCRLTAQAGRHHGIPVSVCGLAAEDPLAAAAFVEMGISKLSVSAPAVNLIKSTVDSLDGSRLAQAAADVAGMAEASEVRDRLRSAIT